jgi:hypothetical protein
MSSISILGLGTYARAIGRRSLGVMGFGIRPE